MPNCTIISFWCTGITFYYGSKAISYLKLSWKSECFFYDIKICLIFKQASKSIVTIVLGDKRSIQNKSYLNRHK